MNLVCIFTSKILKINTVYSLWELYPEIAEKLNEQPNKILKLIFKFIDNYALKNVNEVVVNSDDLKNYLINKRKITSNKIKVVNHFSPFKKSDYQPNFELDNIFYAGNTGRPQNLSSFLRYFEDKLILRVIGYPGNLRIDHPTGLIVESGRKYWLLDDKTLLNVELANDARQAAAEFDLDELIQNINKNRPLRLSLAGVFSELPVPPFVVKEWRSLS